MRKNIQQIRTEHQDYFRLNPWSGYCRAVIAPKVTVAEGKYRFE